MRTPTIDTTIITPSVPSMMNDTLERITVYCITTMKLGSWPKELSPPISTKYEQVLCKLRKSWWGPWTLRWDIWLMLIQLTTLPFSKHADLTSCTCQVAEAVDFPTPQAQEEREQGAHCPQTLTTSYLAKAPTSSQETKERHKNLSHSGICIGVSTIMWQWW